MTKVIAIAFALASAACSSVTGPTLDSWVAQHKSETCVLATHLVAGNYINYGVLVQSTEVPPLAVVMSLSYCNPAE